MVYHGKPSQGCANCRERKIKCDQTRPECRQCTRTNRQCAGYRDEWVLMLRDETETVARKVSSRSRSGSPSTLHLPMQGQAFPLGRQPATTPSKQDAICFFLQAHSKPGNEILTAAFMGFLAGSGQSLGQRAIQAGITAVASGMLARVRMDMPLMRAAALEYGSALRLVNEALADSIQAKGNETLGAVVLLALYELVRTRAPQGIEGWTSHIRGAAALLEHRGMGQLQSEVGIRLFLHLRYQIIVSCLQRDVHVPQFLLQRTAFDDIPQVKNSMPTKLVPILGKLSNLRADIHMRRPQDHQKILSRAYAIETDLVAWLAALPSEFTYTTHTMPLYQSIKSQCYGLRPYNDQYHIYPDLWAPSCWNHYRCARILVSEIILSQITKLSKSTILTPYTPSQDLKDHCKTLRSTIRRLGRDICLSVPFHFGLTQTNPNQTSTTPSNESSNGYIGGLMLLWPLFIAGIVEGPTHPQRKWVMHCLRIIGNTNGLAQALAIMDILARDAGMFFDGDRYGENDDGVIHEMIEDGTGSTYYSYFIIKDL